MRPDPQHRRSGPDPESIIYLGDVRKRRRARRRAPDRQYIAAIVVVALAAWAAWAVVFTTLAPSRLLTYLAFFAPLTIALLCTLTLAAYALNRRLGNDAGLRSSARLGALAAGLVVANLALAAAHRWSLLTAGITIVLATIVNIVLRRFASRTER